MDEWTLKYDKVVNTYKIKIKLFGEVPYEEDNANKIDLEYDNQTSTGLIYLTTAVNLTKTPLLEEMSIEYEPDDLSFINSTSEVFEGQFFWPEISHKYDIFKEIEGKHKFSWNFDRFYN